MEAEAGVLKSFMNAKDKDDQTPLMMASVGNHYSLIELLVEAGAGVNMTDKDGNTAISLIMMKIEKNQPKSSIPNSESSIIREVQHSTLHFIRYYLEIS